MQTERRKTKNLTNSLFLNVFNEADVINEYFLTKFTK